LEGGEVRVIGLIGGMSWNSTLEYYRMINELIAERLGGLHSARLILYSLDFDDVERAQHEGRWDNAASILGEAGISLKRAGADFLVICTNTMHKVAEAVKEKAGLPLVDIIEVIGNSIVGKRLGRVGLLGTRFVMEESFYRERLEGQFGIEVLVPDDGGRTAVDRIIYNELCQGKVKASSRQAVIEIIQDFISRGAEGIILGCTELPLLIRPGDVNIPLFDTTRLHSEAIVGLALADG
jgi:aspartate racemase